MDPQAIQVGELEHGIKTFEMADPEKTRIRSHIIEMIGAKPSKYCFLCMEKQRRNNDLISYLVDTNVEFYHGVCSTILKLSKVCP